MTRLFADTEIDASRPAWWGTVEFARSQARSWRIGPLSLWVERGTQEWRVVHRSEGDALDSSLEIAKEEASRPELGELLRYACDRDDPRLSLRPALADRPIVSRPTEPFFVLPGEVAQIFVSTPVWIQLWLEAPLRRLCEFPAARPSDTWVGATTGNGEAAYASRTFCRLRLEELPLRPHRAATVVRVNNRGKEPLRLERISVAVPHLSLFEAADGRLWTESIEIRREEDDPELEISIGDGAPAQAIHPERLSLPRERIEGGRLRRAFDALL